jgi:PTS system nitrogen regulatory IIA component
MKLAEFIDIEAVSADLASSSKDDVLVELGSLLARACPEHDGESITEILAEREQLATTGIGDGVAIPHGKSERIDGIRGAIAVSRAGVNFDAVDGQPVHIFVALLAPLASTGDHLKALARVSRILKDAEVRARLLETGSKEELHASIVEADAEH